MIYFVQTALCFHLFHLNLHDMTALAMLVQLSSVTLLKKVIRMIVEVDICWNDSFFLNLQLSC